MSIVFVCVGQCGTQLGAALIREMSKDSRFNQPGGPYFTYDGFARCVFIDTEPKVLEKECLLGEVNNYNNNNNNNKKKKELLFRTDCTVVDDSGRGNNWAHGYFGGNMRKVERQHQQQTQQQPAWRSNARDHSSFGRRAVVDDALRRVHLELNRCEFGLVEAIVVVHSVSGGTGSGLGSRLVELLRKHYTLLPEAAADGSCFSDVLPGESDDGDDAVVENCHGRRCKATYLVSFTVTPFAGVSDVSVQHINMVLSLATVAQNCDAVVVLQNNSGNSSSNNITSFVDLNATFTEALLRCVFGHSGGGLGGVLATLGTSRRRRSNFLLLTHPRVSAHLKSTSLQLVAASPASLREMLRRTFHDVALKLHAKAFLWQYEMYNGMTEQRIWDALDVLREWI
eukprot:PhM_4_TR5261/c0_g1_i1/m.46552